ncbi:MAG: hypothetical protein JNK49_03820 [Planctomycetes bacterium]|nr:hypothetical protein [Planctomycetota bacterium]
MQPRSATLILTAVLASTAALAAQMPPTLTLPAEYDLAWGRGSSAGLGSNSTRTQHIFAAPFPIGTPVFGVGFRPTAGTVDRASFTADIEIQISSTAMVPGALSTTFASNIGTDMMVAFPRQVITIPAMPANRGTGTFAEVRFPVPFIFGTNNETNINVDLFVFSRSTGASWSTDRAFAAANGRAATAGIGCGGTATINSTSTGGTYVAGATVGVTLAAAPPLALAFLLPSFNQKNYNGMPLPFDLSLVGADPGCALLVDPALGPSTFVADAVGAASSSFTVPPGYGRFGLGWQWLYLIAATPTNPLGLAATASRTTWIGPEVVTPGAQYVWDLSNVNAVTGNATTNSVPIVEFLLQ